MILAIDPGTSHIGVAYLRGDSIVSTTVESPEDYAVTKLQKLVLEVIELVNKLRPKHIVFEDYGFGGKFFNAEVAEVVGALKFALKEKKFKTTVTFIAPNTVKFIICGSGKATKADVRKGITQPVGSTHEADAVALLLVYQRYLNGELNAETTRKIRGRTYNNV